jgi:N-glycosylase/DNA lyase
MVRELEVKQPLDLGFSLTMGQAFRWQELTENWFSGVLGPNLIHVRQTDVGIAYRIGGPDGEREATETDDEMLRTYLREDQDLLAIYDDIGRDAYIAELVDRHWGMRLLRQDPWESVVAYICSANNNIPRISDIVERIAADSGEAALLGRESRCLFPTPARLMSNASVANRLSLMNLGLQRAPNIIAAAERVLAGELDLAGLMFQPYSSVKRELMKCRGVGNKIADCIALFALDKMDAFPVDVHIGRALTRWPECPLKGHSGGISDGQYAATVKWAQEYFGSYAGYAGQFLFCDQPK